MSEADFSEEVNKKHRIWKKNAPYLYDAVVTNEPEWPSLTVQWMPDVTKAEGSDTSVHRLIHGTHTSENVQNHLIISKFSITTDGPEFDDSKWDSEREEYGGYGAGKAAKLENEIRINHSGEVHRARYMPQNPYIIASRGPFDDVFIFDYTKHPSMPQDNVFRPQLQLKGHEGEGYGMSWSNTREGNLLTAGDDGVVCHWDINANQKKSGQLTPQSKYKGHSSNVEDVSFHELHDFVFASVGDDKKLNLWDLRHPIPQLSAVGHNAEVTCISFNPFSEFILATGSADKTVALWDMRNFGKKMYTLQCHEDEIFQVSFSPDFETVLASSGSDNRVIVWDLSKIEDPSSKLSKQLSTPPPEVLFIHAGHSGKVADFSWNPNRPWTICSSDEFNKLQVWEISSNIIFPEKSDAFDSERERAARRERFGRYGLASGVPVEELFPTAEEIEEEQALGLYREFNEVKKEFEELQKKKKEADVARLAELDKNLKKYPAALEKYEASLVKQEREKDDKELALEKRIREIQEYFGYWMDPKDPRFEVMLQQKEAEEKKSAKMAKRDEIQKKRYAENVQ